MELVFAIRSMHANMGDVQPKWMLSAGSRQ